MSTWSECEICCESTTLGFITMMMDSKMMREMRSLPIKVERFYRLASVSGDEISLDDMLMMSSRKSLKRSAKIKNAKNKTRSKYSRFAIITTKEGEK